MSRRLFAVVNQLKLLNNNHQKTAIALSRFLSNGHGLDSSSPTCSLVKFNDGFLRFNVDNQHFVVSFWTPVNQVADVIRPAASTSKVAAGQEVDTNMLASPKTTVKVLDMNQEEVLDSVEPAAIGTVLSDSGTVVVSSTCDGSKSIQLKLDGVVDDLKKWMLANHPPKPFETQVLEKEKESIIAAYNPMEEQFMSMLVESETQAQKRFKWGGLFLLSAQLGFVARLTWFEYSWDIMEPITWCLTYSMMLGTFSYYIFTTQEFMLPLVEKRAVQERFWKNVRKSQFDVNQFKQLRTQLLAIERRAKKAKSTPFSSSIPLG